MKIFRRLINDNFNLANNLVTSTELIDICKDLQSKTSTDFYGRITIYQISVWGKEVLDME